MRRFMVGAALLAGTALLTGCGEAPAAPADPAATAAMSPKRLSKAVGCTEDPGPGIPAQEGNPGATQYRCLGSGQAPRRSANIVFFTSQGARDVFTRDFAQNHPRLAADGFSQVIGPLWVVWGDDAAVLAAAIDNGGTQG